jgi:UDP-N-acetyl-D-galactosamine dehydrogenase
MMHEYGIGLTENLGSSYDAIIVAVNHKEYLGMDESYFKSLLKEGMGVFIDVKGIYKGKISDLEYWSL